MEYPTIFIPSKKINVPLSCAIDETQVSFQRHLLPSISYSAEKSEMLFLRRVTDYWMLPIGGMISLWMLYTLCQVLHLGDTRILNHGFNYKGELCGIDLISLPYVYWPVSPETGVIDCFHPICVSRCFDQHDIKQNYTVSYPTTVIQHHILPNGTSINVIDNQFIDVPVYPSRMFANQYCFPKDATQTEHLIQTLHLTDRWMMLLRILKSLQSGWVFLLSSCIISIGGGICFLILVPYTTTIVRYISYIVSPLGIIASFLYLLYVTWTLPLDPLSVLLNWIPLWHILFIISTIGVTFGCYCLFSNTISKQYTRQAEGLSYATSNCLFSIPSVIILPIAGSFVYTIIGIVGLFVMCFLLTTPSTRPVPIDVSAFPSGFPFKETLSSLELTYSTNYLTLVPVNNLSSNLNLNPIIHTPSKQTRLLFNPVTGILSQFEFRWSVLWRCCLWISGLCWILALIRHFISFCLSFLISAWYFTVPDIQGLRSETHQLPIWLVVWIAFRYHLGTLQLSALLLSSFQSLQIIAWFFLLRLKIIDPRSRFSTVLRIIKTVLKSLENTAEFLNSTGLAECALHSNDFFPSCRKAHARLPQQTHSLVYLNQVNSFVCFITIIGLASTVTGTTLWICTNYPVFYDPSSDWFIDNPIGLSIATFFLVASITHVVASSFQQITCTLLYCFLVETSVRQHALVFAPDELRAIVEEKEAEDRLSELGLMGESLLSVAATSPDIIDDIVYPETNNWRSLFEHYRSSRCHALLDHYKPERSDIHPLIGNSMAVSDSG